MDQLRHNGGRTPFADISNTTIAEDQNELSSLGPTVDTKERKRQMDRERYAAMSVEQRNEKNRKRREARQRNKALLAMPDCSREDMDTDIQGLHTNQTREAVTVEITGDVQPGSAGFLDNCSTIDFTNLVTDNIAGPNNNISPPGNSIERKRQRDRERYSAMSAEQRDEVNKKRREVAQIKDVFAEGEDLIVTVLT
ncbi:hypothetical protein U9M48_024846 [Paspalum notatum var. saurae]|uniref:Uncharacterized protein n=1 Tax=Paspalum notatum var. saurae TaxID=547442 RepID=A0AAQ3TRI4_PASNO